MNSKNVIKEVRVQDKILRIFADESPESPRNWDNMAKFICFHKRYNLGDEHDYDHGDYSGWEEMKKAIIENEKVVIIKPLFMYDHSGITIATTPFSCRWDSGQIGWVIVTRETILKEYGGKRVTKKMIEKAERVLGAEVETYDQYVRGAVYGFEVVKVTKCNEGHEHEEHIDSCWGFYGDDFSTNGIADHIENDLAEALKAA